MKGPLAGDSAKLSLTNDAEKMYRLPSQRNDLSLTVLFRYSVLFRKNCVSLFYASCVAFDFISKYFVSLYIPERSCISVSERFIKVDKLTHFSSQRIFLITRSKLF